MSWLATLLKRGDPRSATFELYQDRKGEWRARLRGNNREIVWVTSEGYPEKHQAQEAIAFAKTRAAKAPVNDMATEERLWP